MCDRGGGGFYEEKARLVEERQVVCVLGMRGLLPFAFQGCVGGVEFIYTSKHMKKDSREIWRKSG